MADSSIVRAATLTVAALLLAGAGALYAQTPTPARTPANSSPAAEAQRQVAQPFNNAPVWREVRSGEAQFTSIPGRETNVLIQPQGQTWRSLRNGQISVYGGWALVVVVLAIAAVYWIKGAIELRQPPTGRKILRFTLAERTTHWATAISFVILAVSGLIMFFGKTVLLPLIGYTLFSWLATLSKNLHNFVGPLFALCLILMFVQFVKDNLPARGDGEWIRRFGGLFSGREVPSGKINAMEKIWFWGGACVLGIIISATGFILDFPNFDQTRQTMQIANITHSIGAILFMLGALGHIYMGTIGMTGAYDGMRYGYVDEEWAKEHHEYWYNDIKAGKIQADVEGDGGAARRRPA